MRYYLSCSNKVFTYSFFDWSQRPQLKIRACFFASRERKKEILLGCACKQTCIYTSSAPNLNSLQPPQHVCRILSRDCIYLRWKQKRRLQSMWGHTRKGRTRSNRISSLLSGPWATKTSQQPRLWCPWSEYAAQHAGAFCFNLPLTSLQPCFSKSGLNEPQGRMPHKQNKFA